MEVLRTSRMILRRFQPEDLKPLAALYADEEMRQFIPGGVKSLEQTKEELEWFMREDRDHPELGLWATLDRLSGQFLGRCGLLYWVLDGRPETEVAYMITKSRWNEGLATEAAQAISEYAQAELKRQRLVSLVTPGNNASARVARKIGMRLERSFVDELGPCDLYSLESAHGGA